MRFEKCKFMVLYMTVKQLMGKYIERKNIHYLYLLCDHIFVHLIVYTNSYKFFFIL
jgi:hypothetical protein